MNDLGVTQIVKEIKFEGVWGKLEAKNVSRGSLPKFFLAFCVFNNSSNY